MNELKKSKKNSTNTNINVAVIFFVLLIFCLLILGRSADGWTIGSEPGQETFSITTRNRTNCPNQVTHGFDRVIFTAVFVDQIRNNSDHSLDPKMWLLFIVDSLLRTDLGRPIVRTTSIVLAKP